jgi:hypothetical protein
MRHVAKREPRPPKEAVRENMPLPLEPPTCARMRCGRARRALASPAACAPCDGATPLPLRAQEYVASLEDSKPVVFLVGAFAHGKIDATWVDEELNVSEYPLSAAYCLARITNAFEMKWSVV